MTSFTTKASAFIAGLFCMVQLSVAADAELCADLTRHFPHGPTTQLPAAGRGPNKAEEQIIKNSKLDLLEFNDYSTGSLIVDADNDGRDDLLVWSTQGSGRFVYAKLFDTPTDGRGNPQKLVSKASMNLGVLMEPQVFRFKGSNYIAFTEDGDESNTRINRLVKTANGKYELHTMCNTRVILRADTSCKHPACKKLKETIGNEHDNKAFREIEWPHKYTAAAGLVVFYSEEWSKGDFDNTKKPTTIWRAGRDNYAYDNISWALLGQGDTKPSIDPALRPSSDSEFRRSVLPGPQHDRLRRTLAEQGEVLSRELRKPISLPSVGEFFLFNAHEGRTYWAWDFGEGPFGEQIHITYTNANKSDYIGSIRVKRNMVLQPCTSKCVETLDR